MEWVNNIKDYDYQEEILKNNIRNLLVATDIEIMDHVGDSLRNSRGHACYVGKIFNFHPKN